MDKNISAVIEKRINSTIEALGKNNISGVFVKDSKELLDKLCELMPEGSVVASGGSMTINELGVLDWLKSGRFKYLDRNAPGLTKEDSDRIQREAFFADFYFTSSNAVTEQGELYNVDGVGNRVAAIAYGPKKVIFIVGYNKIVKDMDAAVERLCSIAAPANTQRLNLTTTGCYNKGRCTNCRSGQRVCCQYVKTGFSRDKQRLHVFFLPQELGY